MEVEEGTSTAKKPKVNKNLCVELWITLLNPMPSSAYIPL